MDTFILYKYHKLYLAHAQHTIHPIGCKFTLECGRTLSLSFTLVGMNGVGVDSLYSAIWRFYLASFLCQRQVICVSDKYIGNFRE